MVARKLTAQQWDESDERRFSTRDARVFRNATIILMSSLGQSKSVIPQNLGRSPATVGNIRTADRRDGVAGLKPASPPGRTSCATPEYRAAIRAAVATQPQELVTGSASDRSTVCGSTSRNRP
jgi:hypothetical protein